MPNLTIHDDRNAVPPPHVDSAAQDRAVCRSLAQPAGLHSFVAAAARFAHHPDAHRVAHSVGRDVYTMVIPIENIAGYAGDWIIWFAEREQKPGGAPSVPRSHSFAEV